MDPKEVIERVLYSLEKIERDLFKELSTLQLAQAAGYSPFHFQRVFKEIVGASVQDFVRKRRLTLAAQNLLYEKDPITSLAFHHGFSSLSSFNKAFKKQYFCSPSLYREKSTDLWYFNQSIQSERQLLHLNNGGLKKQPDLITIPSEEYVGLDHFSNFYSEEKNQVRRKFWRILEKNHFSIDTVCTLNIATPEDILQRRSCEPICVPRKKLPRTPIEFKRFQLPHRKYLRFLQNGDLHEEYEWSSKRIWEHWLRLNPQNLDPSYTLYRWHQKDQIHQGFLYNAEILLPLNP